MTIAIERWVVLWWRKCAVPRELASELAEMLASVPVDSHLYPTLGNRQLGGQSR